MFPSMTTNFSLLLNFFTAVKEEAELIVKRRPPTQKGLNLKEIREMKYLDQVYDIISINFIDQILLKYN